MLWRGSCGIGVTLLLFVGGAGSALAAPPPGLASHPGHGGGSGTTSTPQSGHDVSWPQCGSTLPVTPAFGIVGVNGGLANDLNPCLGPSSSYPSYTQSELYWAVADATGIVTAQPRASVYVNTGDPGNVSGTTVIADWPKTGSSPYGTCTTTNVKIRGKTYTVGQDSAACAWVYGDEKATQDLTWLSAAAGAIDAQQSTVPVPKGPATYPWWLDVETGNTWQSGTSGIAMNVADLQGMVVAFEAAGIPTTSVGIYSTASQWGQIAGTTTATTADLYGLADWIPGASTLTGAQANCALPPFTGGTAKVALTQWTGTVDNDHSCL